MNTVLCLPAGGMDLDRTFRCGQAFRWKMVQGGWFGVVRGRPLFICKEGDTLHLSDDDAAFWSHYLSLDRDYTQLDHLLRSNEDTALCLEYSQGIRLLRQEPFETLISFTVSQNNNVGRISGILDRLCMVFGKPGNHQGIAYHAFPTPETLAEASVAQLKEMGLGYRAPYIKTIAQAIRDGYALGALTALPYAQAKAELQKLRGVGPKVAECVLLFSLGFDEAFPLDVWVKRIVEHLYPGWTHTEGQELAMARFGSWAGAAQQYLFHYARCVKLGRDGTRKRPNSC